MGRKQTRQQALSLDPPTLDTPNQRYARVNALRGSGLVEVVVFASAAAPTSSSAAATTDGAAKPDFAATNTTPTAATPRHRSTRTLETVLALMPPRFRNVVWMKRGSFVVVELNPPTESPAAAAAGKAGGGKVTGEVVHVLRREHVKALKADGVWPNELDEPPVWVQPRARRSDDSDDSDDSDEDGEDGDDGDGTDGSGSSDEEDGDDDGLFRNTNRRRR
ncbi:hypothetical protein DFJ73DRAFT_856262 [Zopfochytrium polystomum]|nr:hypothetical protein DFJ73DRAFT_856262 [Zopfochytrium polystomum]